MQQFSEYSLNYFIVQNAAQYSCYVNSVTHVCGHSNVSLGSPCKIMLLVYTVCTVSTFDWGERQTCYANYFQAHAMASNVWQSLETWPQNWTHSLRVCLPCMVKWGKGVCLQMVINR